MKPERIQSDVLDRFLRGGAEAPTEVEIHFVYDTREGARRCLEEALGEMPQGDPWPPLRFEPGDDCYGSRVVVGVELGGEDTDPPPPDAATGEAPRGSVGPPGNVIIG